MRNSSKRDSLAGRKGLAASRSAYESGKGDFSDWTPAQRLLRDTQATALNHLTDHEIAIAELEGIVAGNSPNTSENSEIQIG